MPDAIGFLQGAAMLTEQAHNVIHINPDLGIALLLTLVEHQLHPKMQVNGFDIIDILLVGIALTQEKNLPQEGALYIRCLTEKSSII